MTDGTLVMNADNYSEAKYIIYGSRTGRKNLKIPLPEQEIKKAVKLYENYLDILIKEIKEDYVKKYSEAKNFSTIINEIFKRLNIIRY